MGRALRVAVVGAGPSGIYAADALTSQGDVPVAVDVLDRLPVPFGLVRYGVAPDHTSIRSVRTTLSRVLERPGVRFLGNVAIGEQVSLADLRSAYDAVVLTYGASRDRRLGVDGEDLPGSVAATDVVNWYCGHPDADGARVVQSVSSARVAAVIGVGNVAVDVTRILAKAPGELSATDMPQEVLDVLAATHITDVHLIGRRGPAQATFTTKELRELGELTDCDIVVDPACVVLDPASERSVASDRVAARNVEVLREWSARGTTDARRRIHLHFFARPVKIAGDNRVEALTLERTALDEAGQAIPTGQTWTLPCDLVVRSVGYRGVRLEDVPFDDARGTVEHTDGRVAEGLYVAGWIKRGPNGIIGTNKKDANATVAALLADAPALLTAADPGGLDISGFATPVVDLDGWRRIDAAEIALGASRGRERTTIHERGALLAAARGR